MLEKNTFILFADCKLYGYIESCFCRFTKIFFVFLLAFLQLFQGPAPPSAAPYPSLAMGSALGTTLDWARLCSSSVIQVTRSMAPVPSGARRCPTHWPNGTALCQHVSVCMHAHPHPSVCSTLPPAAGEDLWCGCPLWPGDQAAMEAPFQNIASCFL